MTTGTSVGTCCPHGDPRSLPSGDTDPKVIALATAWRIRTSGERRELRAWAEEQGLSIAKAKVRAIGYALLVLQHQQDRPQRVTIASGRRHLVVPSRDLDDVEFARWWRAAARRWARILVTQRADPQMPPHHHGDLSAIEAPDAAGKEEVGESQRPARPPGDDIELAYQLASPQQRRILNAIAQTNATTAGEVDRLLGLKHGQTREQLRRIAEKVISARVPRGEPPPQARAS